MKHKHAELMKLYAEDAAETNTPWERWEAEVGRGWSGLVDHPLWSEKSKYRRKPEKTYMWQWIARNVATGEVFITHLFFSEDPYRNKESFETMGKAEWTKIEAYKIDRCSNSN
jgi:hypothetical protein